MRQLFCFMGVLVVIFTAFSVLRSHSSGKGLVVTDGEMSGYTEPLLGNNADKMRSLGL